MSHAIIRYPESGFFSAVSHCFFASCSRPSVFLQYLLDQIDTTITFQDLSTQANSHKGRTIQLGGKILRSAVDDEAVSLLVRELPIRTEPVYGPVETGKLREMFVIRFKAQLARQDIQDGHMIVVVGTVAGTEANSLTGASVLRPTVAAECFHIWRTQGDAIEDFPWLSHSR
jgi:starvation-inducible outer membrane lipoprotein